MCNACVWYHVPMETVLCLLWTYYVLSERYVRNGRKPRYCVLNDSDLLCVILGNIHAQKEEFEYLYDAVQKKCAVFKLLKSSSATLFHFALSFFLYLILYHFFIEVQQSAVKSTQPRVSLGYMMVKRVDFDQSLQRPNNYG